ncbi:hypothetical protein C7E17_27285, partial [Stenotrophomonas maltophilia]
DAWLKARDPRSGIRDVEAVQALAEDNGFTLPARRGDAWLKARDPRSGIRDVEAVQALAEDNGFTLPAR